MIWFSSSCCDTFWCVNDLNDKTNSIKRSKQIIVISMLKNWSHIYSNHHRIIKYIGFKSIHYVINPDVTSSFKVFNKFDSLFLSDILLV